MWVGRETVTWFSLLFRWSGKGVVGSRRRETNVGINLNIKTHSKNETVFDTDNVCCMFLTKKDISSS